MKMKDIEEYGVLAKGKEQLIKHLNGEFLSRKDAMLAKCYECNNGFADGRRDCKIKTCPLYDYMIYNPDKKKLVRNLSPAQLKRQNENLKKMRRASQLKREEE